MPSTWTWMRERELKFRRLCGSRRKDEFIARLSPILKFLKSYIRRHLWVAYANSDVRIPPTPLTTLWTKRCKQPAAHANAGESARPQVQCRNAQGPLAKPARVDIDEGAVQVKEESRCFPVDIISLRHACSNCAFVTTSGKKRWHSAGQVHGSASLLARARASPRPDSYDFRLPCRSVHRPFRRLARKPPGLGFGVRCSLPGCLCATHHP